MTSLMRKPPVVLAAPAKVNLHLGVYPGRDAQGYHRTDSVMIPLELADEVTVAVSETPNVSFTPSLEIDVENTAVFRAIRAFEQEFTPWCSYGVNIQRAIPSAAGLGSSSTDAAAALRGMATLNDIPVNEPRLAAIARSLGTDVPFFLHPLPALFIGTGSLRGSTFAPLGMPIVLVKPETGVSTPAAYAAFDASHTDPPSPASMCAALRDANVDAVAANLYNNLADAAMELAPEIRACLDWLKEQKGVIGAQVTGSGSCSFAICERDVDAHAIADACPWWACATRTASA